MGAVPLELARTFRDELQIDRAIETGTYRGGGARALASVFPHVVTIELSLALHREARASLADVEAIECIQGNSATVLPALIDATHPTFYWLDGHWSGGVTAGAEEECPILGELAALRSGHPDDVILVDDARLFAAAPPPPHDPAKWPTLAELFDALMREEVPRHITILEDIVLAVPARLRKAVDAWAHRTVPASKERGWWAWR